MEGIDDISKNKAEGKEQIEKKAKAKQLKAYLMLFEQVLANYLTQLDGIPDIFSPEINSEKAFTYYTQPLYNVPGAENIISSFLMAVKSEARLIG